MQDFSYKGFDVIVKVSDIFHTFDIYYNRKHYQYLVFDATQSSETKLVNIVEQIIDAVWNLKTYDDVVELLSSKVNENILPYEPSKFVIQFFVEQILKQ